MEPPRAQAGSRNRRCLRSGWWRVQSGIHVPVRPQPYREAHRRTNLHRHHQMDRKRRGGRAERPDMQIVNVPDAGERAQPALNGGNVHLSGHTVQAQMKGRAEEIEGRPSNQEAHGNRSHGINDQPTRPENDKGRDDNTDRHRGVCRHVQKGPARVQVAMPVFQEQYRRACIDGNADRGDPENSAHDHRGWLGKALDRLPDDRTDADKDENRIGECGQDRRAPQCVGMAERWRAACQGDGAPSDQEAGDVGQIVGCVREQGEGSGGEPEASFHENKASI